MSQSPRSQRRIYRLVLLLSIVILITSISLFVVSGLFFSNGTSSSSTTPATIRPVKPMPKKRSNPENKPVALTNTQLLANYLNAYGRNNGSYPADVAPSNFTPETLGFSARASESVIGAPDGYTITYMPLPSGCTEVAGNCASYILRLSDDATKEVLFDGLSPTN